MISLHPTALTILSQLIAGIPLQWPRLQIIGYRSSSQNLNWGVSLSSIHQHKHYFLLEEVIFKATRDVKIHHDWLCLGVALTWINNIIPLYYLREISAKDLSSFFCNNI